MILNVLSYYGHCALEVLCIIIITYYVVSLVRWDGEKLGWLSVFITSKHASKTCMHFAP